MRLDQYLVELGFFPGLVEARAAIMAGEILVEGQRKDKAGLEIKPPARITVKEKARQFVSRGGLKLERALQEFKITVVGRTCLDVGASTGGFTDCLLRHGAAKVYAIDVGYGQLDWKLRNDLRVVVVERTNVRQLEVKELYGESVRADLAVIDVSFISLTKVLPAVFELLAERAEIVALIKPQFEAKKDEVGRGGIVRDEAVRAAVVDKIKQAAIKLGYEVGGLIRSPIEGADGNVEFLIHLTKK